MPVHVLQGEARIPSHLQRAFIKDLSPTAQCTDKYVKGDVILKYPLNVFPRGEDVLKAVIQDHAPQLPPSSEATAINVFLFGKLAKDFSDRVNQGDTVAVTGFSLGTSATAHRDKRHRWQLELEESKATVYVCPRTAPSVDTAQISHSTDNPKPKKYTYVPLSALKHGDVVNVYGVVTFFKQPFKTKGTDYCSTLTIADESCERVGCSIFSDNLAAHPKIYKVGDIVRFHRVKAQEFNGKLTLVTSLGFAALVFDGRVGSPVTPWTSSKSYWFTEEDQRTLEKLRQWAATQTTLLPSTKVTLSTVEPKMYFDLTCQLLATAQMDRACVLLKVWDGTKCPRAAVRVPLGEDALDGKAVASFAVDVLVYDNHVEVAKTLKPGTYLRLYNLHAKEQTSDEHHLGFHLHGGTSYGRGIKVLPEDSRDLQELKQTLDSVYSEAEQYMDDYSLLAACCTPKDLSLTEGSLNADVADYQQHPLTALTCGHLARETSLLDVRRSTAPRTFHVRAKLKSYRPDMLYQSVKLYCAKCKTLQEVPDEESVASLFEGALDRPLLLDDSWGETVLWEDRSYLERKVAVHFVNALETHEHVLTLVQGATLEEVRRLSAQFKSIVPVKSSDGQMTLLDLSAPFLIQEKKWHYGCKHCSHVKPCGSHLEQQVVWEADSAAKALGVEPLQYVVLMSFELDDGTASLDALLWEGAEKFFQALADEAVVNRAMQEKMQLTIDTLCPPGRSLDELPWLEFCLNSYTTEDGEDGRVYYQIFDTVSAEKV
ncbi:protection of telomeres protein 1 [Amia ocellicauda]|uniref:protection of telomeres protein 1 n=1 Tax=Amia ocellicauda TaxID=2972642 RepID=UPI0034641788